MITFNEYLTLKGEGVWDKVVGGAKGIIHGAADLALGPDSGFDQTMMTAASGTLPYVYYALTGSNEPKKRFGWRKIAYSRLNPLSSKPKV